MQIPVILALSILMSLSGRSEAKSFSCRTQSGSIISANILENSGLENLKLADESIAHRSQDLMPVSFQVSPKVFRLQASLPMELRNWELMNFKVTAVKSGSIYKGKLFKELGGYNYPAEPLICGVYGQ